MVDPKWTFEPSTREEVLEAEQFDDGAGLLLPFKYPTCYDKDHQPWTFERGSWKRTELIGDVKSHPMENPRWDFDFPRTSATRPEGGIEVLARVIFTKGGPQREGLSE